MGTNREIEQMNVQRVILKARTFSQDISEAVEGQLASPCSLVTSYKIDVEYIGKLYEEILMPLTKEVMVDYLLSRFSTEADEQKEKDNETDEPARKRLRS